MPKILNHTARVMTLGTGNVVPANGELELSEQLLDHIDNRPALMAAVKRGRVSIERSQPTPAAESAEPEEEIEPDRDALIEWLESAKKDDLIQWLAEQGEETDGMKVAELRFEALERARHGV